MAARPSFARGEARDRKFLPGKAGKVFSAVAPAWRVVMASRLFRVCAALRALRTGPAALGRGPGPLAGWSRPVTSGGMPTDEEQATGMEKKVLDAIKLGVDPYCMFPAKAHSGTKDDPHLVPSTSPARLVGCICEEDATEVYYMWLHKGKVDRCPSCGAHYKMVPLEMP